MLVEEEILKRRLLLDEIKLEKRILEHERAYITKIYEERISKLNEEIDEREIREANIERSNIFDRETIMRVIAYLVSLVENKSYFYESKKIPVTYDFKGMGRVSFTFDHPDWYYYHIDYICESTSHAKKEIERFSNKVMHTPYDIELIDKFLLEPKENYIQMAFYMSDKKITFINNINDGNHLYKDLSDKNNELIDAKYYQGTSHIRDRKYLYIFDFIDYLSALIAQKDNYSLTEKEMKECAINFANDKQEEILRVRKYI